MQKTLDSTVSLDGMMSFSMVNYTGANERRLVVEHQLQRTPNLVMISGRDMFGRQLPVSIIVPEGSHYYQLRRDTDGPCAIRFFGECLAQPCTGMSDINALTFSMLSFTKDSIFNESGSEYVAHLFATEPGQSKIGIFDGNGKVQHIDCGFTEPAEHIVIKSLEHGTWHILRRINGSYVNVSDNPTASPVVFPTKEGFGIYNDEISEINLASVRYVYMAFQRKEVL